MRGTGTLTLCSLYNMYIHTMYIFGQLTIKSQTSERMRKIRDRRIDMNVFIDYRKIDRKICLYVHISKQIDR